MTQNIKKYYLDNEIKWKAIVEKFCSQDCELIKHGEWHRVYKNKNYIFKIELKNNIGKKITLLEEFELLQLLYKKQKNDSKDIYLYQNDDSICIKIKLIKGYSLDELFYSKGLINDFSIFLFIFEVLKISFKGIKYKQLRARHIFLDENKSIKFIDFGLSKRSNIASSLFFHFSPLKLKHSYSFQLSTIYSLIILIIKKKYFNKYNNPYDLNFYKKNTNFRHKLNSKRSFNHLPKNLAITLGDRNAANHLQEMENNLDLYFKNNISSFYNSYEIKISFYGLSGVKDWNLIFFQIVNYINLKDKIIIDYGCGLSPFGPYGKMMGIKICYSIDDSDLLLLAAKNLSNAFGFKENIYSKVSNLYDYENLKNYNTNSIFVCTHALLEKCIPKNISLFREAILLVENTPEVSTKVHELGFTFSKTILSMSFNRKLIYLSK